MRGMVRSVLFSFPDLIFDGWSSNHWFTGPHNTRLAWLWCGIVSTPSPFHGACKVLRVTSWNPAVVLRMFRAPRTRCLRAGCDIKDSLHGSKSILSFKPPLSVCRSLTVHHHHQRALPEAAGSLGLPAFLDRGLAHDGLLNLLVHVGPDFERPVGHRLGRGFGGPQFRPHDA